MISAVRPCVDSERVAPISTAGNTPRNAKASSHTDGSGVNGDDPIGDVTEERLHASHSWRRGNSFTLPPSQFLLGLQSFSIGNGSSGNIAHCLADPGAVQWLLQQHKTHKKHCHGGRKQWQDTRWHKEASGRRNVQERSQCQTCRQHPSHDSQRQLQQPQSPQKYDVDDISCVTKDPGCPPSPLSLLPASVSPTVLTLQAEAEGMDQPDAAEQQKRLLPLQTLHQGDRPSVALREPQRLPSPTSMVKPAVIRLPGASATAGTAGSGRRQQPQLHQHCLNLEGHMCSTQQRHRSCWREGEGLNAEKNGRNVSLEVLEGRMRDGHDGAKEAVRYKIAERFQVIKKMRHPHLCAYTHMLRKGRRVYVVSEYWSLSLADVLNQQLLAQQKSCNADVGAMHALYTSCPENIIPADSNSKDSGSNSISWPNNNNSVASIRPGNSLGGRDARGGRHSSITEKNDVRSESRGLPILPEEFLRRVAQQVLSALEYLNSLGIVHARLSLSAIRFDADGNVRVAEWGLQHLTAYGRYAPQTQVHSPVPFLSPETFLCGPFASATPPFQSPSTVASVRGPCTAGVAETVSKCPAADVSPGHMPSAGSVASSLPWATVKCAPAMPATSAVAERPNAATDYCYCSHSCTGDVFALGVILLHLLQGPPRTVLPGKLLKVLQKQQESPQPLQQSEERLDASQEQRTSEADESTQQQKQCTSLRDASTERLEQLVESAGKYTADHDTVLSDCCHREDDALTGPERLRSPQQHGETRQEKQYGGAKRQQDTEKKYDQEEEERQTNGLCNGKISEYVKQEISKQFTMDDHPLVYGQSSGDGKVHNEMIEKDASPSETDLFVWDEWEGCERKRKGRKVSGGSPCRSTPADSNQSLFCEGNGSLQQEPACCLNLLRQIERVALLLLYVHCGYEGLQRSLECRFWEPPCPKKDLYTRAVHHTATAGKELQDSAASAEDKVAFSPEFTAYYSRCTSHAGSCIGLSLKQFLHQHKQGLLEKLRLLVRGPSSVIVHTGLYTRLLESIAEHMGAETSRHSGHEKAVQQQRQSVRGHQPQDAFPDYCSALHSKLASDRRAGQRLQPVCGAENPIKTRAVSCPITAEGRNTAASFSKHLYCSAHLHSVEDFLLETVLANAVDWLSGRRIWPALFTSPLQHNLTEEDKKCRLKDHSFTRSRNSPDTKSDESQGTRQYNAGELAAAGVMSAAEAPEGISSELRDFLRMCLAFSSSDRLTPTEALNCAWLQKRSNTVAVTQQQQQPHSLGQPESLGQPSPISRQQRKQKSPCSEQVDAKLSQDTRIPIKNTDVALWCPQAVRGAVALLQQLQAAATLRITSPTERTSENDMEANDDGGKDMGSMNIQTLLQEHYGVEVEEVFYWWQLLGHDVDATLTSMGALHPVSSCLRLPLASLLCNEPTVRTSLRAFSTGGAAVNSDCPHYGKVAVDAAPAVNRELHQEVLRADTACVHTTEKLFLWTHEDDAAPVIPGQVAACAAGSYSLTSREQHFCRIPFLLPFADLWGQLHGATLTHSTDNVGTSSSSINSSKRRSSSSRRDSTGGSLTEGHRAKRGSREAHISDAVSASNAYFCCCTRSDGGARWSCEKEGGTRTNMRSSGWQKNNRQSYKSHTKGNPPVTPSDSAAEKYFPTFTDGQGRRTSILSGEYSSLSVPSGETVVVAAQTNFEGHGSAAGHDVKDTDVVREVFREAEAAITLANAEECTSFFAAGLQEGNREWTNTGFFWKEEDARTRGVELVGVVKALREADSVPVSKAKELSCSCVTHLEGILTLLIHCSDPPAMRLRTTASFSLSAFALPASWRCLLKEAAVDIPPLLRPQVWAALLQLNYDAEVAAGSFLFDQLVLEAPLQPVVTQLETVKFFDCHEYHDLLGSYYGRTMLRRLLQAFFLYGASYSVFDGGSRASSLDRKCSSLLEQLKGNCRGPSDGSPFDVVEPFQKLDASETNHPWAPLARSRQRAHPHNVITQSQYVGKERKLYIGGKEKEGAQSSTGDFIDQRSIYRKHGDACRPVEPQAAQGSGQATRTVRGLDALAAPLLLLYEPHPQLALLSLERFLVRHEHEQLLLISTPEASDAGPSSASCKEVERPNQHDSSAETVASIMTGRSITTVATSQEAHTARGTDDTDTGFERKQAATLQNLVQCYSRLLAFVDPILAAHLSKGIGLKPEMYVVPWLLTFFSHVLELPQLYLLWDVLLVQPPGFVLFVAVCLVHCLRVPLLKLGVDDELSALTLLQNATAVVHVPALAAAAAALQEATPPSLVCCRIELTKPTVSSLRIPLSRGATSSEARSFSPDTASPAALIFRCALSDASDSGRCSQQLPQQAQDLSSGQHEQCCKLKRQRQRQQLQQQQRGSPRAPQLIRNGISDICELKQKREPIEDEANFDQKGCAAAGVDAKYVIDAEQSEVETEVCSSCRFTTSATTTQRFYIGEVVTSESGEEQVVEAYAEENASRNGLNEQLAEHWERESVTQQSEAEADELEDNHFRFARPLTRFDTKKRRAMTKAGMRAHKHPQASEECSNLLATSQYEGCNIEEWKTAPCGLHNDGKTAAGARFELQRGQGYTSQMSEEHRQESQGRAWNLVAAVFKGPALMLMGPPRKASRHRLAGTKGKALQNSQSSSGGQPSNGGATSGRALSLFDGNGPGRAYPTRSNDGKMQLAGSGRREWQLRQQVENAYSLLPFSVHSADCCNAVKEPSASAGERNIYCCGLPQLTLKDFMHYGGAATVLDVRSPRSFFRGHLVGAVNVSPLAPSALLVAALAPAAAAASAIRAPFPTELLEARSTDDNNARPPWTPGRAPVEDTHDAFWGNEQPSEERCSQQALVGSRLSAKAAEDAVRTQAMVKGDSGSVVHAVEKSVSEPQFPSTHMAHYDDVSTVTNARACSSQEKKLWPSCAEAVRQLTTPSHPWICDGLPQLNLVVVMGTMQSAARLAFRLRDSGVPHVCVIYMDDETLVSTLLSKSVRGSRLQTTDI